MSNAQMTPERWQQIEKLFYSALEREPSQRALFLAEACAGQEDLRQEVESLLANHEQGTGFFESLPKEVAGELLAENQTRTMKGRMLGRYQLLATLGVGGMGEVYRALDTRLDREVAVKILPPHLAASPEARLRFEREAKAVAALSHPNILAIHDFGADEGVHYAVMELLKGQTLRGRLLNGALPWRKAVSIGIEIADGLAAAHAQGITHRDLKPENIFLTAEGRTKILDFGLARVKTPLPVEHLSTAPTKPLLTNPGVVMGTLGYMSPEQVRGEEANAPSDIFSFGCVLYEMLTGQPAFACMTAAEKLAAILRDDPPELPGLPGQPGQPGQVNTGKNLPLELTRVLTHCLEKNPAERFQSAHDLAFALKSILNGSGSTNALPQPATGRARFSAPLAAVLLLLLFGLAWYLYDRSNKSVSLVVLPFTDGKDSEYILDGITESIINSLSLLPQLRVIARTTAFSYKERALDPTKIGRELGVQAVATGRAVLQGDGLIIQADLVDVATGAQIWGDKFERKRTDILAVQAEIARTISEKLRLRLTGEQQQRLTESYTQDAAAYDLYLKGLYLWNKRTEADVKKGNAYFTQAIAKDQNYALAYVGLANSYIWAGNALTPAEAMSAAKAMAEKALSLNDTLAEAHTALAAVNLLYDWDWAKAEREFQRAIALNPNYPTAYQWYAEYLTARGRHIEALVASKQALKLDPLSPIINRDVGWHYYCARQYDQAIEQGENTLKLDANFAQAHTLIGLAYVKKRMFAEAIAKLQKALELSSSSNNWARLGYAYAIAGRKGEAQQILDKLTKPPNEEYVSPYYVSAIYAGLGDKEHAVAWLEKGFLERTGGLIYLKVSPLLDGLRSDHRFRELVQRVKLPD